MVNIAEKKIRCFPRPFPWMSVQVCDLDTMGRVLRLEVLLRENAPRVKSRRQISLLAVRDVVILSLFFALSLPPKGVKIKPPTPTPQPHSNLEVSEGFLQGSLKGSLKGF